MLTFTQKQKDVLDALLMAEAKIVAGRCSVSLAEVYNIKYDFNRKVQNAEEFLAVARSKYKPLLSKRLKTPKVMPEDEEAF